MVLLKIWLGASLAHGSCLLCGMALQVLPKDMGLCIYSELGYPFCQLLELVGSVAISHKAYFSPVCLLKAGNMSGYFPWDGECWLCSG